MDEVDRANEQAAAWLRESLRNRELQARKENEGLESAICNACQFARIDGIFVGGRKCDDWASCREDHAQVIKMNRIAGVRRYG